MLKYFRIAAILLPLIFFNCERDISSSYNYNKTESITLIIPQGGERFTIGQPLNIQWSSLNLSNNLRLELMNNDTSIYSVNDIPNSGNYVLLVPSSIIPSKKYKLKLESMVNPEVSDTSRNYFEIAPLIDGHWSHSYLSEFSGLELDLDLFTFGNDSFLGRGHFHFQYLLYDEMVSYERTDTVGGVISYPDIRFVMRETGNKEFNFTGKMTASDRISGRITGFIDSTYGNMNDTLTLRRQ